MGAAVSTLANISDIEGLSKNDMLTFRARFAKEVTDEFNEKMKEGLQGDGLEAHMMSWIAENKEKIETRLLTNVAQKSDEKNSISEMTNELQEQVQAACERHITSLTRRNAFSYLTAIDGSPQSDLVMSVVLKLRKKNDHIRVFHSYFQANQEKLSHNLKAKAIETKMDTLLVGRLPTNHYTLEIKERNGEKTAKDTMVELIAEYQEIDLYERDQGNNHTRAAKFHSPDFMVMGFVGNKKGAAALDPTTPQLGSVVSQTLKVIHMPTFIIKRDIPNKDQSRTYVCAVGKSSYSKQCLDLILSLVRSIDHVIVLHVLNLTIDNDSSLELLKKEYEDELLDNGPINSKFITLHKSGEENAIEALLNYINNETDGVKVDFIAIAPRMNHIEHSCFSSMTTQLILNAKTNILVCKH
jgi:hypothetical protein